MLVATSILVATSTRRSTLALAATVSVSVSVSVACREAPAPHAGALETQTQPLLPRGEGPGLAPAVRDALTARPAEEAVSSFRVDGVGAGDILNMRRGPDAASALVGAIPPGVTHVEGLGSPSTVGPSTWQRVRYAGAVGWVNARFLKPDASPLAPLICFGTEPFWALEFAAEGGATCGQSCEGLQGLRVAHLQVSPAWEPQAFDIATSTGQVYLRGVMQRTGQCSDGMSDNLYPYVFSGVGRPGSLEGCCRVKTEPVRTP